MEVGVEVEVRVAVGVSVTVAVGVTVGVEVGVTVFVGVDVGVGRTMGCKATRMPILSAAGEMVAVFEPIVPGIDSAWSKKAASILFAALSTM